MPSLTASTVVSPAPEIAIRQRALASAGAGKRHLFLAILVAALVGVLYAPVLRDLVQQCWDDPNYGHGFLVPLLAAWILWRERSRLRGISPRPANIGLLVMLAAVALLIAGSLGAEVFISRVSLIILLAGMALLLSGREMLRAVAFPLFFLAFMIPLPALIYYQITFPLQLIASRVAAACFAALHVP